LEDRKSENVKTADNSFYHADEFSELKGVIVEEQKAIADQRNKDSRKTRR